MLNFTLTTTALPLWVFALQAAAGALVPLAVAALPIRRASRLSVREAIDQYGVSAGSLRPRLSSLPAAAFGSMARWEELLRSSALGLAGGSGWVILTYDFRTRSPRITWSGHHTQSLAFGRPLLVLDIYEHSYAIDYGAAAARYVDAFFDNIQWDAVSQRWEEVLR